MRQRRHVRSVWTKLGHRLRLVNPFVSHRAGSPSFAPSLGKRVAFFSEQPQQAPRSTFFREPESVKHARKLAEIEAVQARVLEMDRPVSKYMIQSRPRFGALPDLLGVEERREKALGIIARRGGVSEDVRDLLLTPIEYAQDEATSERAYEIARSVDGVVKPMDLTYMMQYAKSPKVREQAKQDYVKWRGY